METEICSVVTKISVRVRFFPLFRGFEMEKTFVYNPNCKRKPYFLRRDRRRPTPKTQDRETSPSPFVRLEGMAGRTRSVTDRSFKL